MRISALALCLLCCAINAHSANTLRVINCVPSFVADPRNVFIQLNYTSASINPPLAKFEVVYPFTAVNNVWTLEIGNIQSGNLVYGIDPAHDMEKYSKVRAPDVHLMFNGLFEFTLRDGDSVGYWDISNVDWIGMLCSARCVVGGYPEATWHLDYYKTASELIGMVVREYQFTAAQRAAVLMHSNVWGATWAKLLAPNHSPLTYVASPGGKSHLVDYLNRLMSNNVPLCLKADLPSTDHVGYPGPNPPDWQNRVAALGNTRAAFTGRFHPPSAVAVHPPLPGPGLTDKIVLVLSNAACRVMLYYSIDAINPGTTYRNDSDGGLWVRYCTDIHANTWEWVMVNRHLNCVTPGNPSFFEAWVASLANRLCYSINAGLIPTNSNPAHVYTFSGNDALVHTETNTWQSPPYSVNMYNDIIINNSDSYGMGYSDANPFGVRKVVRQTKRDGAIVELRLLNPGAAPTPGHVSAAFAADFDGDRKADPAVYDTNGAWQINLSSSGYAAHNLPHFLGGPGWMAFAADFDGDGKADPVVYNADANGAWQIKLSSGGYVTHNLPHFLGGPGWTAFAADFDGDGKADPAVYHAAGETWKFKLSTMGYHEISKAGFLGGVSFTAFAADFDGDGKADPVVYNADANGAWQIKLSSGGYVTHNLPHFLGGPGWAAFAADFDGDGKADPAVCHIADGYWQVKLSSGGYHTIPFGPL